MLRGCFLAFILPMLPMFIGAQNYVPFPTDSARWKVSYGSGALGCPSLVAEYQYEISGDTVISSVTYHKITKTGYTNNFFCYPPDWGYVGCYREDTLKHIYFIPRSAASDTLLYDFNLSIGDTVQGYLTCFCMEPIVVDSIDSILVGNGYRRRYIVDGCNNMAQGYALIEGIGSSRGLLDCIASFESGALLDCFSDHGQTIYPDTTTFCPILIESVAETQEMKWSVYPNPAADVITFQSNDYSGRLLITITNLTGQIVRSENISASDGGFTVSRNGLPSGIYFIEILDEQGRTSRIKFAFL